MKNLKIQLLNVRVGHATNSSSLHSMIGVPGAQSLYYDNGNDPHGEYGWDFWTAVSEDAKLKYLAGILYESLRSYAGETLIQEIIGELLPGIRWFGYDSDSADPNYEWNYIDHQSLFHLPADWEGRMIDREFFADLKRFISHDDIMILGGNDNDDRSHPIIEEQGEKGVHVFDHMRLFDGGLLTVARKDPVYGFWAMYSRGSGVKIRFRFDQIADPECVNTERDRWHRYPTASGVWKDNRSSLPELVDLKITDFCTKGCEYCYQSSGELGAHGDTGHIKDVIDLLAARKVFEVAIGGGEPTEHPDFWAIIAYCKEKGIVPNFSTKRLKWMQEPDIDELMKPVGGFAYSVRTVAEASAFLRMYERREIKKGSLQYVLGSSPLEEFEGILRLAGEKKINVTILGYKNVGRGQMFDPNDYSAWIDVLMRVWDFKQLASVPHFEDRHMLRYYEGYKDRMIVTVEEPDRFMIFDSKSTSEDGGNVHGAIKPINLNTDEPGCWLYTWRHQGDDAIDVRVGIDTAVAAEFHEKIKGALQVPDWLYDVEEGLHSFYVDCVYNLLGPSSYNEDVAHYRNRKELIRVLDRIDLWDERKLELERNAEQEGKWRDESEEILF
jgi:hypothetical protein